MEYSEIIPNSKNMKFPDLLLIMSKSTVVVPEFLDRDHDKDASTLAQGYPFLKLLTFKIVYLLL